MTIGPPEHREILRSCTRCRVPNSILKKPGKLTFGERRVICHHRRAGARIPEAITAYAEVVPIVLQHHEKYDGTGYPNGIAGGAISLGGRIVAVANFLDALISDRPYRPALERKHVIELIEQEAGHHFDPEAVQAFLEVMAEEDHRSQCRTAPVPSLVAS